MNSIVKHDAITVRSCKLSSGITGSFAMNISVYMNPPRNTTLSGRAISTSGCVHGTNVPPVLSASRNNIRNRTRLRAPR